MIRTCRRFTALLILICLAGHADAQFREDLAGQRVRVYVVNQPSAIIGRVVAAPPVSATLDVLDETGVRRSFDPDSLRYVQQSDGYARVKWAAIGAVAGLAAGVALGSVVGVGDDDTGIDVLDPLAEGMSSSIGAMVYGAGGLVLGGLIGAAVAPERWRTVPLTPGLTLELSSQGALVLRLGR